MPDAHDNADLDVLVGGSLGQLKAVGVVFCHL